MKILVRLPNWLGDLVMSVGFVHQLPHFFPGAEISVVVKKGIHELLPFFPPLEHRFVFSKNDHPGVKGILSFGREINRTEKFDLFFSLPNSFSTALMGFASGSKRRIGFKKELRQIFLTDHFQRPQGMHRAEEYIHLLELFTGTKGPAPDIRLHHQFKKQDHVVVNINSEASSRRLTVAKAAEIISALRNRIDERIVLIGAPKEKEFVDQVVSQLPERSHIENLAGQTTLSRLAELLASSQLMLSTDSGPAHLANALGTHTIVLFGAGNENHTAPYNQENRTIIRLDELSCEPCEKNICVRYGTPQCLERLNTTWIVETVNLAMS